MHRWQIGDVEIVRVEDLDFALPTETPVPTWCVPAFAPSVDEVGIAFSALAIAADGVRIVVDPWMANDGPRTRPDAEEHARGLLRELGDAGFPPDEVDVVVNTHFDGVGWNTRPEGDEWVPSFPNARYLYPADEIAAIDRGSELFREANFDEVRSVVDIESVSPPLVLTPTVTLDPAPGHNYGHVAVRVESGDDIAVYGGHLFLTPFHVADPESEPTEPDHDRAVETRQQILGELAARRGLLLTTLLGGPGGGRVARDGDGFRLD